MRCLGAAAAMLIPCFPAALPAEAQRQETRIEMSVFFRWNAGDLDPSGAQVIEAVVGRAKTCKALGIELVGHDDTSQSGERAQELSELRAKAVQQALVEAGIPARRITTEGRGDREPMFNTLDGVQESMNRRVEIGVRCAR